MSANLHFMVRVSCMTYNHENYIVDALNGFVIQQTSFPVVYTIVDDASTDNNVQVIKKFVGDNFDLQDDSIAYEKDFDYGHVVFARHNTNNNCFFAIVFLKENHYSQHKSKAPYLKEWMDTKYVALCEGDDYWTDPIKLQKQVDFLEAHPDYSLCCHRFKRYYEKSDSWSDDYVGWAFAEHPDAEGLDVTNLENFRTRFTWTLTLCYRKSVADAIEWHPYLLGRRDFTFHYHLLKAGKGYCFADFMGVYRVHSGGVWQGLTSLEKDRFRLNGYADFYSYHKDDVDVRTCYLEWLDQFYQDHALSVFASHRITRKGVNSMFFASRHYMRLKGPFVAINKCCQCIKQYFFSK